MSQDPNNINTDMLLSVLVAEPVQAFAVFGRLLNFTHASEELNISMPSLHAKINKLQSQLGIELYIKHGKEFRLTPAGSELMRYASDAKHLATQTLAQLKNTDGAPMTIAAGRGGFLWVARAAIARLSQRQGGIRVETAKNVEATRLLRRGLADVAILGYNPPPEDLEHQVLATYAQSLVVRAGHRLAGRNDVTVQDLSGLRFALPERGTVMRDDLARVFRSAQAQLIVEAEAVEWDVLIAFVTFGIEATIVNEFVATPSELTKIPITNLKPATYYSAWRTERSELADEFNQAFNQTT